MRLQQIQKRLLFSEPVISPPVGIWDFNGTPNFFLREFRQSKQFRRRSRLCPSGVLTLAQPETRHRTEGHERNGIPVMAANQAFCRALLRHPLPARLALEEWRTHYFHVLGNWLFLLACSVILLQNFARYGLLTWVVGYYEASGIDLKGSLLVTVSLPIGMGLGAFAGGYVSDRFFSSRRTVVVCLFLVISTACCLYIRAHPVSPESEKLQGIAMLFFAGFFVFGAQGPLWALCPDLVGRDHAGTAVGVMDAVAYAGAAAQGPILGYLIDHPDQYGYPAVFLLLAILCTVAAGLALVIRR